MNEIIETVELPSRDGFDLRLELLPDYDCKPVDDEGLTPWQVAAWREDRWGYVVRHVIASKAGIDLGDAYLGGTEYGEFPCTTEDDALIETSSIYGEDLAKDTRDFCAFLIEEAIAEAELKLAELTK